MMLVGAYPFASGNEQQHTVVRRIMKAQFELPARISPSCTELLTQLFCINPHERISIEGIKRHPWYTRPLPSTLEVRISRSGVYNGSYFL